jgi:hypothetical protein
MLNVVFVYICCWIYGRGVRNARLSFLLLKVYLIFKLYCCVYTDGDDVKLDNHNLSSNNCGCIFIMGGTCSRKRRGKIIRIIHDNYTQTETPISNTIPSRQCTKTRYSSISHDLRNRSSNHYVPSQRQLYSTSNRHSAISNTINIPLNGRRNLSYHRSNPSVVRQPSRSQVPINASVTNPHRVSSTSKIVYNTFDHEHRAESYQTLTHVKSSLSINTEEQSNTLKRSASIPIDMFLIDVSNEYVRVGQPVSMNIRHLLLDTPEHNHTNSLGPAHTGRASTTTTTNVHEDLFNYIPYMCEKYPNSTVSGDQRTHNTLHVPAPRKLV